MAKVTKYFVLVVLFVCSILAMFAQNLPTAQALSEVDQGCSYASSPEQYTFLSHEPGQIFMPTKNMLDAVQVYIKAGVGASANVKMEVLSQHSGTIATKTQTVSNQWSWVVFDLLDVTMPMDIYGIKLRNADAQSNAVWMQGPASCYPQGWAIYEGHAQEYKYRFAINAFDAQNPTTTPAETSTQNADPAVADTLGTIGVTSGSGAGPTSNTSTSISAVTNLTAANESNYTGTGIRLNWTASTTADITGYKIYRSNSVTSGFVEIGRVVSGITIYIDPNVVIGQTYYYTVRSYKGTVESASSNVASATAKDTFKEDILKDYKANSGGVFGGLAFGLVQIIIPLMIFGLIFILIIVGIVLMVKRNRQKKQNQSSEQKK